MTAHHQNQPRYVIATVTGYTITPGYHESNSRAEMTCYTVLDRAYNHHTVATFTTHKRHLQQTSAERAHKVRDALNNQTPIPSWDEHGREHHHHPEP